MQIMSVWNQRTIQSACETEIMHREFDDDSHHITTGDNFQRLRLHTLCTKINHVFYPVSFLIHHTVCACVCVVLCPVPIAWHFPFPLKTRSDEANRNKLYTTLCTKCVCVCVCAYVCARACAERICHAVRWCSGCAHMCGYIHISH